MDWNFSKLICVVLSVKFHKLKHVLVRMQMFCSSLTCCEFERKAGTAKEIQYIHEKENQAFSVLNTVYIFFPIMVSLCLWIFSFKPLLVALVLYNTIFILSVCGVCERQSRICKWTNMGYDRVVKDLSLVGLCSTIILSRAHYSTCL